MTSALQTPYFHSSLKQLQIILAKIKIAPENINLCYLRESGSRGDVCGRLLATLLGTLQPEVVDSQQLCFSHSAASP